MECSEEVEGFIGGQMIGCGCRQLKVTKVTRDNTM